MKKISCSIVLTVILALIPLVFISCNGSDSCGDSDEASIKYEVDMGDWQIECLTRLEWIDEDGVTRSRGSISQNPWRETFCAADGAHLYLYARVECGEVTIKLYIDNSLVERKTRDSRVTIDGYLKIDDEGNATFEDSDD